MTCTGLVKNFAGLMVVRVLLGIFESVRPFSLLAGIILLTFWVIELAFFPVLSISVLTGICLRS